MNIKIRLFKYSIGEILFFLAIALKPIYLRGSGTLQISDFILLFVIGGMICRNKIRFQNESGRYISVFLAIIIYQLAVNVIWTLLVQEEYPGANLVYNTLFYVFNFLVVVFVLSYLASDQGCMIKRAFLDGVVAASIINLFGMLVNYHGGRSIGFFNNPNQVGYFCLVTLTIVAIYREEYNTIKKATIVASSVLGIALSLSKAAIIGAAVLVFVLAFQIGERHSAKRMVWMIVILIFIILFTYLVFFSDSRLVNDVEIVQNVRSRILNMMSENDTAPAARGYGRIGEIGALSVFGVGEGAYRRYEILTGGEAHTLYISLITCYGFIGFFAYVYLWLRPFFKKGHLCCDRLLLFVPILLYNLTHNGIRNPLVWILLAIIFMDSIKESESDEASINNFRQDSSITGNWIYKMDKNRKISCKTA